MQRCLKERDLPTEGYVKELRVRLIQANEGRHYLPPGGMKDIRQMSEQELKQELGRRNLDMTGDKRTLYRRLNTQLQGNYL